MQSPRPNPSARRWLTMLGLLLCFVAAALLTPLFGAVALDTHEVLSGTQPSAEIFWQLRLPRVLLAMIVGAALALAGAVFQALLRNDLATPFTLGVASGASLGAVLTIHLGIQGTLLGISPLPIAAFIGAGLVLAVVLALVRARGPGLDTATLLLAGVTLSFLCSAVILLIQFLSDFTSTNQMVRWMMGGLETVGYDPLIQASPLIVLGAAWVAWKAPVLDQLLTGDLLAASRGVRVRRERIGLLTAASLMTAAALAFTGPIGFVGLIVPHAMRRLVGPDHRWLLPACVLGGGALLPVCDTIARTVIAPAEMPVGVLTALIGAPFFLVILLRRT